MKEETVKFATRCNYTCNTLQLHLQRVANDDSSIFISVFYHDWLIIPKFLCTFAVG